MFVGIKQDNYAVVVDTIGDAVVSDAVGDCKETVYLFILFSLEVLVWIWFWFSFKLVVTGGGFMYTTLITLSFLVLIRIPHCFTLLFDFIIVKIFEFYHHFYFIWM